MTSPLRRTTTTALAALCLGALLTATAPASWAASPLAGDGSTSSVAASPTSTPGTGPADGGRTVVLGDDGSATITIDADRVKALCERVPQARTRAGHLLDRIQGDGDVLGSAAWLSARADTARTAGRDALADRLDARAERRTDRVAQLQKADDRLARAQQDVCVPAAAQLADDA